MTPNPTDSRSPDRVDHSGWWSDICGWMHSWWVEWKNRIMTLASRNSWSWPAMTQISITSVVQVLWLWVVSAVRPSANSFSIQRGGRGCGRLMTWPRCRLPGIGWLASCSILGTGGLKLHCPGGVSGTQEFQMPRNTQTTSLQDLLFVNKLGFSEL